MERYDVAVVGAGPGGLDRRLPARASGRARAARRQGELPARQAVRRRRDGARRAPAAVLDRARRRGGVDRLESASGTGPGSSAPRASRSRYMTQRKRLDHFLLQQAAAAGADVRDGVKVADVRANALTVDGETVQARIVSAPTAATARPRARSTSAARSCTASRSRRTSRTTAALRARDGARARTWCAAATAGSFRRATTSISAWAATRAKGRACASNSGASAHMHGVDPDAATDTRGYRLPNVAPGACSRAARPR